MDHSALEGSSLFFGVPAGELGALLAETPHRVRRFDRGEAVFRLLEPADLTEADIDWQVADSYQASGPAELEIVSLTDPLPASASR